MMRILCYLYVFYCRVAGRVSVVKELREAFDCGEKPVLSVCFLLQGGGPCVCGKGAARSL